VDPEQLLSTVQGARRGRQVAQERCDAAPWILRRQAAQVASRGHTSVGQRPRSLWQPPVHEHACHVGPARHPAPAPDSSLRAPGSPQHGARWLVASEAREDDRWRGLASCLAGSGSAPTAPANAWRHLAMVRLEASPPPRQRLAGPAASSVGSPTAPAARGSGGPTPSKSKRRRAQSWRRRSVKRGTLPGASSASPAQIKLL
jgi:hypothetical protein